MEQQQVHGQNPHEDVHLPDPSPWPLVAALATLVVGAALVWWSNDRSNDMAAITIAGAAFATLFAVGGWAWEDSRMRRRAAQHAEGAAPTRFTQVITFSVPEGMLDAARAKDGVLAAIDASDNALRTLRGFQDLRITVSPAAVGPSQVLVETTWSDREGLASYEETRRTILDLLAQYSDQVVPGSVQVFDMEVVRDTKDVAFRFSLGAAATIVGAFILGGFMIGSGLALFGGEGSAAGGTPPPTPRGFEETGIIPARNIRFLVNEIRLPPNTEVTLTFDNRDPSPPHNIQFHAGDKSAPLLRGCKEGCSSGGQPTDEVVTEIATGPIQQKFTFVTPGPGRYTFVCVVHPVDMVGTLVVEEGAPVPPGARPAGSGEASTPEATATTTS